MRYLSKQFETAVCKSYRPFSEQEWEQEQNSELFCVNYGEAERIADERRIRETVSLAAQLGINRVVAEIPSAETERIAKFYSANGVNRMCSKESTDEAALEYYMRLGYFLGEGTEFVNVAILEPNEEDCRMFSKHGIAYHVLTNVGMMKYGFVAEDKIGCGMCKYDFLVLPSAVVFNKWVERYVRKFLENGGNILLLGDKPVCAGQEKYECSYLKSTCTFGRIAASQIYRCKNTETQVFTTYRSMNEMQFLYVVNASENRAYEQTFDFGEKVHSFLRLDLTELTTVVVPLTIALHPGEDAILMPYARKIEN